MPRPAWRRKNAPARPPNLTVAVLTQCRHKSLMPAYSNFTAVVANLHKPGLTWGALRPLDSLRRPGEAAWFGRE